jgi:hypothetical protein
VVADGWLDWSTNFGAPREYLVSVSWGVDYTLPDRHRYFWIFHGYRGSLTFTTGSGTMKLQVRLSWLAVMMVLSGCSSQADTLPTLMPSVVPDTTIPSSPTAEVVATVMATEAPTNVPAVRPTLPPEWTAAPAASATPAQAQQATAAEPVVVSSPIPTLAACGTFVVDYDRTELNYTVGQPVIVAWSPVTGASRYLIQLLSSTGTELWFGYTTDTFFEFPPERFNPGGIFGWNSYPEDSLARQMCIAVGGAIAPTPP